MLGLFADVLLLLRNFVEIDVLVVSLGKHTLKLLNTLLVLLILFLLHDKLLDKFFSLHLLLFVLSLELPILGPEHMVLAVNPLRNIGDQVKMMFNLRFSFLQLVPVFPSLHSFLLIVLFSSSHVGPVLASDLFKLLFFELAYFVFVVVDALVNVLLVLLNHAFVGLQGVFFKPVTDPQFSLQKFDFLAVVPLVVVVPLYPPDNFLAHLFIGLKLVFVLGH